MILKGSLNIVTDAQMAVQASASSRVLFVGELKDKNPANFITCSILLPPYEAINAEINGDIESYDKIYMEYLAYNKNVSQMFNTIIVALYQGINITLFIENSDMRHYNILINFLINMYGINPGTANNVCSYNDAYDVTIASILYGYLDGFISDEDYLKFINYDILNVISAMNIPYIMNVPYNKLLARFCIDPKGPMTDPNQLCLMPNVGIYVELVEIMRKLKMVRGYKGPLVRFKK